LTLQDWVGIVKNRLAFPLLALTDTENDAAIGVQELLDFNPLVIGQIRIKFAEKGLVVNILLHVADGTVGGVEILGKRFHAG
jgi:hypothetical protein